MHTSGGAACGRDDDGGGASELCVCQSLRITKIREYSPCVNDRIMRGRRSPELNSHALAVSYPPRGEMDALLEAYMLNAGLQSAHPVERAAVSGPAGRLHLRPPTGYSFAGCSGRVDLYTCPR